MRALHRNVLRLPIDDQLPVEGQPTPEEDQQGPIDSAADDQPQPTQE